MARTEKLRVKRAKPAITQGRRKPMHDLTGKTAIITGSASGIGRAQAELFAVQGANVIVADRDAAGKEVAGAIGSAACFVQHDVTSLESWSRIVEAALETFGGIDILVNTAGVPGTEQAIEDLSLDTFTMVWQVNTLGVFLGIKSVVPTMKTAGRGAIVNVVSAAAMTASPGTHAYAASKWGTRGMTRTAARELARFGIRVNSIYPGPVHTPMLESVGVSADYIATLITDVDFAARPEDIAQATLYLVSDEARHAYGAELAIDGGQSIASGGPTRR